ncbi:MAG: protein kinase, partial [Myxococcota bacterium]
MTPQRYQRLMELFDQVCPLPADQRSSALAEVRVSDPRLADELQALLLHDQQRDDIFASGHGDGRLDVADLIGADSTDSPTTQLLSDGSSLRQSSSKKDSPAEPDAVAVGTVIAERYRLLECLGAGGAGRVFRARDQRADRDVAVKVLHRELMAQADQVRRFRREFRAISRIDHPGCLSVYAEGVHDGDRRYLVMEYAAGG